MDKLKRKSNTESGHVNTKISRNLCASISNSLTWQETKEYVQATLQGASVPHTKPANVDIFMEPFQLCRVKEFLSDYTFINELREELLHIPLIYKCNDLYQYHQSADLCTVSSPAVNAFKELMHGHGRDWMTDITGKELNYKVVMNFSAYNYTDHLLCHDDNTEDRLIAFVFYLTSEKWTELDGGQLQMFNIDNNNQPAEVARSLNPDYNSFVFFEVTRKSFHQVAEVLSADRTRLSINGWFHGTPNAPSPPYKEPLLTCYRAIATIEPAPSTSQLFNNAYLNPLTLSRLSEHFEKESELFLTDFMNDDYYMKIALALQSNQIKWMVRGPADRRNYLVADEESLPNVVKDMVNFLKSNEMFEYLEHVTQLDLSSGNVKVQASSAGLPTCTLEVQCWHAGHYTLVHDHDSTLSQQVLDVCLYFNAEAVDNYHGGFTSYIARDADEELMTVTPQGNGLAMTFRDKDTLRFVKYVNHRLTKEDMFHAICLTYSE